MHVLLNDCMQLSDGVLKEVRPQRCTVGLAVGFAGQRGRTLPEASVGACACPYLVEWLQLLPRCLRVHTSSPLSINQSTINNQSIIQAIKFLLVAGASLGGVDQIVENQHILSSTLMTQEL